MSEERPHASDIPDWCDETLPCGQLLEAKQENQELRSEIARLRLFMPDCYARIPLSWNGEQYEIQVFRVASEPSQE